jgi:RNA polymerase sigma factor (sigma-70 family)
MTNLTNLVKEFKTTKNKQLLDKICLELKPTVIQKAKFIYYAKWYPLNLYHPCKFCRNCEQLKDIPKEEHNLICKECTDCKCVKGFFNLRKNNLCDYEDVENDLWCEILRIVDNFDITKDFNTYLFSCLWEFIPTFITKDFVKSLSNKSLTHIDEEGNETQIDISDTPKENTNFSIDQIYKICKTSAERKIIDLLLKGFKQIDIANELKVSEQYISKVILKLKSNLSELIKNEE